jgi:Na+/glutamate symporter
MVKQNPAGLRNLRNMINISLGVLFLGVALVYMSFLPLMQNAAAFLVFFVVQLALLNLGHYLSFRDALGRPLGSAVLVLAMLGFLGATPFGGILSPLGLLLA